IRRRTVTSTLCKARAPATTGAASGHHGVATSKGARAPIGSPDGPTTTSVTIRGTNTPRLPRPHEISARSAYLLTHPHLPHARECQETDAVGVRQQPKALASPISSAPRTAGANWTLVTK